VLLHSILRASLPLPQHCPALACCHAQTTPRQSMQAQKGSRQDTTRSGSAALHAHMAQLCLYLLFTQQKKYIRMQNEDGCKIGRACRSLQECCQLQASAMRLAALQQALHPEAGLAMSCASLPRITPLLPTLLPRAVLSAKEMCRGARSRVYEMHQIEHAVQKSVHQRAVAREPASMPPLAHAGNAPGGVARGCATWGGAGHDARSHFLPTFSITSHLLPRSLP